MDRKIITEDVFVFMERNIHKDEKNFSVWIHLNLVKFHYGLKYPYGFLMDSLWNKFI